MKYAYATKLSEHIHKDNIGQLICTDVPIARSGSQDYLEDEINGNGSSDIVKLERPWAVVKASAPTFEGKPFLESHPTVDITVDNIKELSKGHIQNVRADDKQEILVADIIVKDKNTIELIETKKMREISCGYFYDIDENNVVTEIRGEHVALVPEGRAGNTKILDEANDIYGGFLTIKPVEDVKVGDWLLVTMRTTKNKEFVEVIKIVENKEKEQIALLLSNHVIYPEFLVYDKGDEIEGLFGDIKPAKSEKELSEKDHANYLTEKLGDEKHNYLVRGALGLGKGDKKYTLEINSERGDLFYDITAENEEQAIDIAKFQANWWGEKNKDLYKGELPYFTLRDANGKKIELDLWKANDAGESGYILKQVGDDTYYKSHIDGTNKIIAIFNVNNKESAKHFDGREEAEATLEKLNAAEKQYELLDLSNKAEDGLFDNIYIFMVKFFDGDKKYIGLSRDYEMEFIDEPEYAAQFDSKDVEDELSIRQRRQIENDMDIEQVVAVPLNRFYSGGTKGE